MMTLCFSDSGNNPKGGRPAKEYAISLDMAKELAMAGALGDDPDLDHLQAESDARAKGAWL